MEPGPAGTHYLNAVLSESGSYRVIQERQEDVEYDVRGKMGDYGGFNSLR